MELGNAEKNLLVNRKELNKYYVSDENINLDNLNDSHALIAKQVKKDSIILDVGCAQGLIGSFLHKEFSCKVYGIEIDNESRKIAENRKTYEKIYNFSITDKKSKKYIEFFNSKIKYDYIILADILEHLVDPADTIYELQKLLKKDGKILISIPNISHFDIIHALMNNEFNYSKVGLLDNTHIRFFTENSFVDMINDINDYYDLYLNVKLVAITKIEPEYMDKYPYVNTILKEKKEINILQNIFELSIGKNKINKKSKNIDLCDALEQRYQYMDKVNNDLNEANNKLFAENTKLQEQNHILNHDLNKILNSKGYKLLLKFYRLKSKAK